MFRINRRAFLATSTLSLASLGNQAKANGKDKNVLSEKAISLSENIPVIDEADICVIGGSPTGVFAAVRAARLGARVILIEKQNHFGGVASITCTWHKLMNTDDTQQIIAGLTQEVTERLKIRKAVNVIERNHSRAFEFSPGEFKIVLDELVLEAGIKPYLHTVFSSAITENNAIKAIVVENKSGRGAIKAKYFIDATGDGDLCARVGLAQYSYDHVLPPTMCAFIDNWNQMNEVPIGQLAQKHGKEFNFDPGFIWGTYLPETDVYMLAGTRVKHVNCTKAEDLTHAEMEGRRQVKAILQILEKYQSDKKVKLIDFPASIGIRDTRHIRAQYQIKTDDVLNGTRYPDAIANGSYRVDVHHQDKPGITLKYLDGTELYYVPGKPVETKRWREKTDTDPTFYQVPLRSLIPGKFNNLMLAGRMLDAEKEAFGAIRVQVNTNQMGEAAGVTSWLALDQNQSISMVLANDVRKLLTKGGSIII